MFLVFYFGYFALFITELITTDEIESRLKIVQFFPQIIVFVLDPLNFIKHGKQIKEWIQEMSDIIKQSGEAKTFDKSYKKTMTTVSILTALGFFSIVMNQAVFLLTGNSEMPIYLLLMAQFSLLCG